MVRRLASFLGAGLLAAGLLTACGDHKGATPAVQEGTYMKPVGELAELDVKLFEAAGRGDVGTIEETLDEGANVNAVDKLKRSPLFAAAFFNRSEAALFLIARGADVNAKDFSGFAPLHAAVVAGSRDTVATLVAKGANINDKVVGGRTPLHLAAATNQPLIVEFLLGNGASPAIKDGEGHSAATLAALNGHAAIRDQIKRWTDARNAVVK